MSHEWHRGVLTTSSWHGLEDVGVLSTADDAIDAGEKSGAYPVSLNFDTLSTPSGLTAPVKALVASYRDGNASVVGAVGDNYRATSTGEWRDLIRAAVAAGAKPTGAFSLRDGARVLATFDVGGNGIRTQLVIADSFDRSMRLTCGTTAIRVVCANTLSAAMRSDGEGMARLTHTNSLETKVNVLREAIGETIKTGEKVRDLYHRTETARLNRSMADALFDQLFPVAPEDAGKAAVTKAENLRAEARAAAMLPINNAGPSVATLWNAATYIVDRNANGSARKTRGDSAMLDSMLFGARAKRIEEIQHTIEVVMASGEIERMTVTEARDVGIDARQIGRSIIAEMLAS